MCNFGSMKNEKSSAMMKMKNIYLLLFVLCFAIRLQADPMSNATARTYYEKGKQYFRAGDYKSAEFQFEYASFHLIHLTKVIRVKIGVDGLRHTTHQHI